MSDLTGRQKLNFVAMETEHTALIARVQPPEMDLMHELSSSSSKVWIWVVEENKLDTILVICSYTRV